MLRTLAELECGHITTVDWCPVPPEYVPCLQCPLRERVFTIREVRLFAVECREWRISCESCTYSRFAGSDHAGSLRLGDRHATKTGHGSLVSGYILVPRKRDHLADAYGRTVKPFIRSAVKPVAKGFAGRPRQLSAQLPDEPEF